RFSDLLYNLPRLRIVDGVAVYPVRPLTEVVEFINGTRLIDPVRSDLHFEHQESQHRTEDFRDVRGQFHAKRAIEVAMGRRTQHAPVLDTTRQKDETGRRSLRKCTNSRKTAPFHSNPPGAPKCAIKERHAARWLF